MNKNEVSKYNYEYVENLLKNLKPTNIEKPEEVKNNTLTQNLYSFGINIFKGIERNALYFSGSTYYDESKARQLVIEYINNPECTKALQPHHKKIVEIYDRLAHISNGKGNWAEDIDSELLQSLQPSAPVDEEIVIEKLDELIARNVLLPELSDEVLEGAEEIKSSTEKDPTSDSYVFKPVKKLAIPSARLIFHIHADEFGQSSEYEGGSLKDAVEYLHAYLQQATQEKVQLYPQELIEELKNAVNLQYDPSLHNGIDHFIEEKIQEYVQRFKAKITTAFQSKKPLLLMGGWTGRPAGHAIYYEIIPISDKTAHFRLYNSGKGNDYHSHGEVGHKIKYIPYTEWQEIDRARLESDFFLQALYELKSFESHPKNSTQNEYDASDIYEALKELLKPAKEKNDFSTRSSKQSPQRSGVCSWKSLMAFLHTQLNSKDYKRFKCDIKLQSLSDYVLSSKSVLSVKEWRLIKKSYKNLCAAILVLYRRKIVGDAYIRSAQEILNPIAHWVQNNADCRFQRGITLPLFKYVPCTEDRALENKHSLAKKLGDASTSFSTQETVSQPWKNTYTTFTELHLNCPTTLQENLQTAVAVSKKSWEDQEDLTLYMGIVHIITQLELKDEFWQQAIDHDQKKAKALIVQLGELAKLFLKSCYTIPKAHILFPEKRYVLDKIVILQELLCRLGHPGSVWQDISSFRFFSPGEDLSRSFYNAKMHREVNTWNNDYYPDRKAVLINLYNVKIKDSNQTKCLLSEDSGLYLEFKKGNPGKDTNFQDIIRSDYPEVIRAISQKDSKFYQLKKCAQDARIYASEDLPLWIKSLRDADIAKNQLNLGTLGPVASLNRNSDIQCVFEIKDEEESTTVNISFRGVTKEILKNPEVKKNHDKGLPIFFGQYRDINDPEINKLLIYMDRDYHLNEKKLLSTKAKKEKFDMADEDFKELSHIFIKSPLQHVELLAYFTKHPEKIKNTDFQTLFQTLLFRYTRLMNNLEIPGFVTHLSRYIQNNFEQFLQENEIQTAVFLLKIAHQLHGFCLEQKFFKSTLSHLKNLANREGLEPSEKSLVYAELIAQLGHEPLITQEEAALIIAGSIYVEENQPQSNYSEDPYTAKEMRETLLIHADKIQAILEKGKPNNKILGSILKRVRPEIREEKEWAMKVEPNQFPVFMTKDGEHLLYPMLSRLISPKVIALLPLIIRQNALFQQLFPEIDQGYYLPGNIFSFKDKQGRETRVCMKGDYLIIDQKLDSNKEAWYRYIPASSFTEEIIEMGSFKKRINCILGSRALVHSYSHWQSLEVSPNNEVIIYAIDLKTGKPHYRFQAVALDPIEEQKRVEEKAKSQMEELKKAITEEYHSYHSSLFEDRLKKHKAAGVIRTETLHSDHFYMKILEVTRILDGLRLGRPSALFKLVEDVSYIHEWYDQQGRLKNMELPRFNLSFTPDPNRPDPLRCDAFPKFTIDIHEPCKELGSHHDYIRLRNIKGQCKIILPKQSIKAPSKKEVLKPEYEMDRSLELHQLEIQKYFAFDLQKNGRLHHPSRVANLYLAQVLVAVQEYKKAVYYLKKCGDKLSVYTKEESDVLQALSSLDKITGDQSGNGNALRLYASYLLVKNALSYHQKLLNDDLEALSSNYNLYLDHYSHATVLKLKPPEEIFILKTLLALEFKASHYLRLKELDPKAAKKLHLPLPENTAPQVITKDLRGFEIPISNDLFKYKEKFLTRHHKALEYHFFQCYDIARKGNQREKQWLQHAIAFVRTVEGGRKTQLADFFEAVLQNPQGFPEAPVDFKKRDNEEYAKWEKTVIAQAEKQMSLHTKQTLQVKNRTETIDLVTSSFRLDPQFDVVQTYTIPYSFSTPISLAKTCKDSGCFQPKPGKNTADFDSLSHLLLEMETDDPVQRAEISRLKADLEEYKKKAPAQTYQLSAEGLTKVKEVLSQDKRQESIKIESLEKKILNLANKPPSINELALQYTLEKGAGQRKVITLEELLVYFAQQDFAKLLQRNPSLNEKDVSDLVHKIGNYLLYATKQQQRSRAEVDLKKLEKYTLTGNSKETEEYKDLVNKLAQDMLAERAFVPAKRPAFLVFEYYASLCMRSAQVEKLETFLKEGDQNLIMEMIMGSGKSKVLLPLLGFMRADGKVLSMLIVPQPLFESISQDTQNILRDAFSQSLHAVHFDRNTPFTKENLQQILDKLTAIRNNKECLIMTSKSVQCLLLKFVEECDRHFKKRDSEGRLSEELKITQQILLQLISSAHPIVDEADTILNVLHEVSFSGGRRLSPYPHEIELLSEIYSLIYEDPEIKALARVESDPHPNEMAPVLTESLYAEKVKRPLAEALIQRLGSIQFDSAPLTAKMHEYIKGLNNANRELLLHYLCRDPNQVSSAQAYYDSLDKEVQNILALAGEEISHLIPYALTRVCDVKYGLDTQQGTVFAIPFTAANVPSTGSQFSNPHITMNYTFQSYMKKGVTYQMVESKIQLLQENAMREMAGNGGKMLLRDTLAGKAFNRLKGPIDLPLFNYKPVHIEALVYYINDNPKVKRDFVTYQILPEMELYENKFSCNPHHLVSLFTIISGFTGTLWNGLSMHHKLKPQPELGTDAKTLSLLWEYSRSNAITIKEGTPNEMLKQLKDKSIDFDVISDAGGYFKQGSNSDIAHEMAAAGKETVFYNKKGEQSMTASSDEVPLTHPYKSMEKRRTFLDQSHTVGADVPQKWDAVSLVTIGQNMLLRDLLQAVWRLRGLDKSQRVRFLISEEVTGIIRQKLKLSEGHSIQLDTLLRYVIANQAYQQGVDNYKALREELYNVPQQILLKALLKENLHPKTRLQAFQHLKSTWIKSAFYSSRELYGNLAVEKPSDFVLDLEKKQSVAAITDIFTTMPWLKQLDMSEKKCLDEVDNIMARIKKGLPAKLQTPAKVIENDQTVEMEKETNTQTEKQTQLQVQESTDSEEIELAMLYGKNIKMYDSLAAAIKAIESSRSFRNSDPQLDNTPVVSLKVCMENDPNLKEYASAFDGIYSSINILEWSYIQRQSKIENVKFLGSHRADFQHLIIKDSQVILLGQEQAAEICRGTREYFHLNIGFNDPDQKPTQDQLYKITKLKFLNGESQFNPEELNLLKQWFKAQGVKKLQKLYIEHILKGFPKKSARYLDSPLQKLFADLG